MIVQYCTIGIRAQRLLIPHPTIIPQEVPTPGTHTEYALRILGGANGVGNPWSGNRITQPWIGNALPAMDDGYADFRSLDHWIE